MNIPELHDIDNLDFVDEMAEEECEEYLFNKVRIMSMTYPKSKELNFNVVEASMRDGDTFIGTGDSSTEAIRDLTKKCINHYLLTN